jgi:hypothetical protein
MTNKSKENTDDNNINQTNGKSERKSLPTTNRNGLVKETNTKKLFQPFF